MPTVSVITPVYRGERYLSGFFDAFVADSLWTYVVSSLGAAGAACVTLLFGVFLVQGGVVSLKAGMASRLGVALLIVVAWDVIRSFASSEFVLFYCIVSGVFMAGLVVEIRRAWCRSSPSVEMR